jgi:hypothetical protein
VDPYGATPFRLGPGSRDFAVYVKPDGDHLTTVSRFDVGTQAEITATLRRWAGASAAVRADAWPPTGLPRRALLRP